MPGDNKVYGFNKEDTIELINLIGNADGEFPEGPFPFRGGGGVNLFLYTLTSATHGTIKNMADTETIETGVEVINTLGMFGDQVSGDRGVCALDAGVYYRLAGPCKT